MNIKTIPLSRINPAAYNPRVDLQPGDPEYEKLRRSIETFGYVEPIVWNQRTVNMVGGHQRYKVLRARGDTEAAVSVVDLDEGQERLLNLALNKVSGRWDEEALARLLEELQAAGAELDLSGFEPEEIGELIAALPHNIEVDDPVVEDDFNVGRALEQIKDPETRRGDVWQLGRHRLVCGDVTDEADVLLLMDGAKAALVVTDPPYNVAVESDSERLAADGRDKILNDDMPAAGIEVRAQCVWVKNAASFGWSQYRWQHEPVFYAHLRGRAPAWYGDRRQSTVWRSGLPAEEPDPSTVWEVSRGNVNAYVHPTQKPLPLLAIPISNSSQCDDVVVDFFGGSGSMLVTYEQMGRECRLLELDPVFCDVIKERFRTSTGIEPKFIHRKSPDV